MAFEATPMADESDAPARDAAPVSSVESGEPAGKRFGLSAVPSSESTGVAETPPDPDGPETPPPSPPERGRPQLKVIK